jgi:hypothetical protein
MRTPGLPYFLHGKDAAPQYSTAYSTSDTVRTVPYRAPGASFMCEAFIQIAIDRITVLPVTMPDSPPGFINLNTS